MDSGKISLAILFHIAVLTQISSALNNGLGLTPPMGWNSWNTYGCDVDETIIKANADKIVELGLDKSGYLYVNIDDCWQDSARDENGTIKANATRFPSGMKALADYVHGKGLKFGIYSSAGNLTCQQRPGSLGYETNDAQTYSDWGVDYLKYDNCYNYGIPATERYTKMRDALMNQTRKIYYSICNWGEENPWMWGPSTGNSWRTTADIQNSWGSIKYNFKLNSQYSQYSSPGSWNDPDMLEVGNGVLSETEERTHFALWAFVKAPLILGNDLTKISATTQKTIQTQMLIDLNQDPLGQQATCVMNCNKDIQVWKSYQSGKQGGAYYGLLVVNWHDTQEQSLLLDFVIMGVSPYAYYNCKVTDMWTENLIGSYKSQYYVTNVGPHDTVALKVTCSMNGIDGEEIYSDADDGFLIQQ